MLGVEVVGEHRDVREGLGWSVEGICGWEDTVLDQWSPTQLIARYSYPCCHVSSRKSTQYAVRDGSAHSWRRCWWGRWYD